MLKKLLRNEEGASMTEYVLLIALIGLAVFAIVRTFGQKIETLFQTAGDSIDSATSEIEQ